MKYFNHFKTNRVILKVFIYVLSDLSFTYGTIPNIFPHKKMSRCATVYCVTYCNLTELTVYCTYVTERQLCSAETVLVG